MDNCKEKIDLGHCWDLKGYRKSICNLSFEEKEDTHAHDGIIRIRRQNKHNVQNASFNYSLAYVKKLMISVPERISNVTQCTTAT